jgi:hypothetical protein
MFRVLAQMTDAPKSKVLHQGHYSAAFTPGMGWEQGDTLATTMFNVHVNAVLAAVWAQHQGVPLAGEARLVALMFADDFVGAATSAEQLQRLIDITRRELQRWRIKASVSSTDSSKTAVMVVGPRRKGSTAGVTPHVWRWGQVLLPIVHTYKYLGVMLSDDGDWETHLEFRLGKATKAKGKLHGVLHNTRLPWEARRLALTGGAQPCATYGSEVVLSVAAGVRQKLDAWQMGVVTSMVHCPPNACHCCVQQELGLPPLHVTYDVFSLTYWHRLQRLPASRLVKQALAAWNGAANPWQQQMQRLLAEYSINTAAAAAMSKGEFKGYVARQTALRTQQLWQARSSSSSVAGKYNGAYAQPAHSSRGKAQPYWVALSGMGRGRAAELMLRLRTESLQLNAMHSYSRRGETAAARAARQQCGCCNAGTAETAGHFIFECAATQAARQQFEAAVDQIAHDRLQALHALPLAQRAARLVDPAFWGEGVQQAAMQAADGWAVTKHVASFICDAWKARTTALTGRETEGLTAMV